MVRPAREGKENQSKAKQAGGDSSETGMMKKCVTFTVYRGLQLHGIVAIAIVVLIWSGSMSVVGGEGKRTTEINFDYFILALQWPATVCRSTRYCCPSNGCCSKSSSPTEFTIHGLWPEYNNGRWPACCSDSQFDMKKIAPLVGMLNRYWPSFSCNSASLCHHGKGLFWAHEWEMHGTCSYPIRHDEYSYFSTALDLYLKYNMTEVLINAGFVPTNDDEYPLGAIISTIEENFGASPLLVCKYGAVAELRICFNKDFTPRDCSTTPCAQYDILDYTRSYCPRYISFPEFTASTLEDENIKVAELPEIGIL